MAARTEPKKMTLNAVTLPDSIDLSTTSQAVLSEAASLLQLRGNYD